MTAGWTVEQLQKSRGFTDVQAYRTVFYSYTLLGLVKFGLSVVLSKRVEVELKHPQSPDQEARRPLLEDYDREEAGEEDGGAAAGSTHTALKTAKTTAKKSWLPSISPSSRLVLLSLCILFGMDCFASGLAPL